MSNIDIRESNNTIIKFLEEDVRKEFPGEKFKVIYIKEDVYAVEFDDTKNIGYFTDAHGKALLGIRKLRKEPDYEDILKDLGYIGKWIGA